MRISHLRAKFTGFFPLLKNFNFSFSASVCTSYSFRVIIVVCIGTILCMFVLPISSEDLSLCSLLWNACYMVILGIYLYTMMH